MFIVDFVMGILIRSIAVVGALVGSIILAGIVLGILKNINSKYIQLTMGWSGIMLTAWIGTPVHELGHAVMCLVFGHKVTDMKLLRRADDNVLGYVHHAYNKKSIYHRIGNFFIGIGPIISGTLAITFFMWLLVPSELSVITSNVKIYSFQQLYSFQFVNDLFNTGVQLFNSMFVENPSNYKTFGFWLFIVLAISISSHMALSTSDMQGAFSGLLAIFLIAVVINIASPLFHGDISKVMYFVGVYNSYLISALLIAIFCSVCATMLSLGLYGIKLVLFG